MLSGSFAGQIPEEYNNFLNAFFVMTSSSVAHPVLLRTGESVEP